MKFRFSIIIGYTTMFLWIWMLSALHETELSEMVTRTVPMVGLALTMWLIYRLEWMAKKLKKNESAHIDSSDQSEKPKATPNEA